MHRWARSVPFVVALVAALVSCAEEEYPAWLWNAQHAGNASVDAAAKAPPGVCVQTHAESLPARLAAMSASTASGGEVIFVSDLFQRFEGTCGACHGPAVEQGGFQIASSDAFATTMTAGILAHAASAVCPGEEDPTNPVDPMPPCSYPTGLTFTQRAATDPVRQFVDLVDEWLAAGSPQSFTPSAATDGGGGAGDGGEAGAPAASAFTMTAAVGNAMTNIGNCVPSPSLLGTQSTKSAALDAMFAGLQAQSGGTAAQAIGLPEHLGDTDLVTFDSQALAAYGVIAYAPGYPLWSDDAGKLRYVRVPRGTSIRFDKTTQTFAIPPNTRFYKTFMKQIADTDGSYRYRKIETRLIVSRPDVNHADGTVTQTALFGTYLWNADESDAVLNETPLNSGEPFADNVILYDTDEQLAADVQRGQPFDLEAALLQAGAARHYAVPSSQRCMECHEGSPSESFILGFTPLQINRRPTGVGGTIEEAGPDELTQLQRFIDAGIVTGIDTPADVLPLEQSQGSRAPRNDYELVAQGYMLGNCAHCHNPRGYPTVQNPVLADVLDFLPGPTSGIFQFPLERYSPRIERGVTGSTPIPYITPSLMDLPRSDPTNPENQAADVFTQGGAAGDPPIHVIYAPWRSLIYRNVDSAFSYTDDLALYPHMPMNTPGYDPRAKRIMSDWMVSIPAVRKSPEIVEYAFQTSPSSVDNYGSMVVDGNPQPYVEVAPGDSGYDDAASSAALRISILHSGVNPAVPIKPILGVIFSRYDDPGQTDDIEDPAVTADPVCHPVPVGSPSNVYPFAEHPEWVVTDLSQSPPPWVPRRSDWANILVDLAPPPPPSAASACPGNSTDSQEDAFADQQAAITLLQSATLDQVRTYATTLVPFGLWQQNSGCNFSTQPTVQSITAAAVASGQPPPNWMTVTLPPPSAPVYRQTPGAAVFRMICINCHGPLADANGRLAQNLATMTGGFARVADFRDGLLGPVGAAEAASNRHAVFGSLPADAPASWTSLSDDDRAARYMPWMALGGTLVQIPDEILELVGAAPVFGQHRLLRSGHISANMLSVAKSLCLSLLGPGSEPAGFNPTAGGYLESALHLGVETPKANWQLLAANGDAELWLSMCSASNPPPIHVLNVTPDTTLQAGALTMQAAFDANSGTPFVDWNNGVVPWASYPADAPIGNEHGQTNLTGPQPGNEWPWCVKDATSFAADNHLPVCPPCLFNTTTDCAGAPVPPGSSRYVSVTDGNAWAVRGAINAGMSVYLYLESLLGLVPGPDSTEDYTQCELLH
jgi:mono/diheme cytochrome c family protein